jgi:hypothetical protein
MGLPAVMLGVGLAGAAVSAGGAIAQGDAAKANADYQAQVAANNAMIARQNAVWTEQSGEAKVAAQGMKTAQAAGTAKATQGASNIDVNSGSAANVRQAIGKLGALDALTIRSNTARTAYGYEVAATSDTAEAGLLRQEGSQEQTGADIGALGTFLSGASSVGGNYAKWQMGNGPPVPVPQVT